MNSNGNYEIWYNTKVILLSRGCMWSLNDTLKILINASCSHLCSVLSYDSVVRFCWSPFMSCFARYFLVYIFICFQNKCIFIRERRQHVCAIYILNSHIWMIYDFVCASRLMIGVCVYERIIAWITMKWVRGKGKPKKKFVFRSTFMGIHK